MYQSFLDSKEVYQILNGDMQVGPHCVCVHVCVCSVLFTGIYKMHEMEWKIHVFNQIKSQI